ncbi:MAG: hypothetical protein NTY22_05810 [Proteobacteria bacterium]|nr:hypothetical protein [Pseudomonadota bacterium]
MQEKPILNFNSSEKKDVLLKLLEIDREETRFWQRNFFIISYGVLLFYVLLIQFACGIDGVRHLPENMLIFLSLVILVVMGFYVVITLYAKNIIKMNHFDLIKIQKALLLHTNNTYLDNDSIYKGEKTMSESYLGLLLVINVFLGFVAIVMLLT